MQNVHLKISNMTARYNIHAFEWDKQSNSFRVENPIFGIHPTDRSQFYIVNEDTGGFRRFIYTCVKGYTLHPDNFNVQYNVFESEDGIKCFIKIKN